MKKFAFIPKKFVKRGYILYTNKAQFRWILRSDIIKLWIIVIGILISMFFYLKYVNLSSTEWYFLRKATNELNVAKFNYETLKIKILEHEKETWDKLIFSNKSNPIETIEIHKDRD